MTTLRLLVVPHEADVSGHAARVLSEEGPADVVVVRGAPTGPRWRSRCGAIARRCGMVVVAGGRTGGGALLLSSLGVDVEQTADVAPASRLALRPAGAVVARLQLNGRPLLLAAGRLDGEVDAVNRALDRLGAGLPRVVVGSGNTVPAGLVRPGDEPSAPGVVIDARLAARPAGHRIDLVLPA